MANLRERGQIILVAAFALGVIFIALAVVVNAAIFTENLATRTEATEGSDALQYRYEVRQSVGEALDSVNADGGTETEFNETVENISEQGSFWQAENGRVVSVEPAGTSDGRQFESDEGNFTQAGNNDHEWTLDDDARGTRNLEINITDDSNLSSGTFGAFNLSVDNGSTVWNMTVYRDGSDDVALRVSEGNGHVATCETPTDDPVINVTGGTLGGEPCSALRVDDGTPMWYGANVSGEYEIRFENATEITGVYSGVVNSSSLFGTVNGDDDPALYSARVEFLYRTTAIRYDSEIRVAPGEPPV